MLVDDDPPVDGDEAEADGEEGQEDGPPGQPKWLNDQSLLSVGLKWPNLCSS